MITLIVERTIRYDDARWISLRFRISLLLRANHDQRELACRLPYFIFLYNFLCICRHIFGSLIISWLGTLHIVDFVSGVMSIRIDGWVLLLFLLMYDPSASHNIKTSLCFSNDFSILMLLETDVFLLEVLLCRLIALIDRFWMDIVIESFWSE